jgi:hypothetical protein
MKIDPVLAKVERSADLRRLTFEADDRHDWVETERLGKRWRAAEDDERDTSPTTPQGAAEKLRLTAYYAEMDVNSEAQGLAKSLARMAKEIERRGPSWRHLTSVGVCIATARAIVGGEYTGIISEVVPRLEALLRWLKSPGLIPPPTLDRLSGASGTQSGKGKNGGPTARRRSEWRPWLSIVPVAAPEVAPSAVDRPHRTGAALRLVRT